MGRASSRHIGPSPGDAKHVLAVAVVVPNGLSIAEDEVFEGTAGCQVIEVSQVADESTLELLTVCAAVAWVELALIGLNEDAV